VAHSKPSATRSNAGAQPARAAACGALGPPGGSAGPTARDAASPGALAIEAAKEAERAAVEAEAATTSLLREQDEAQRAVAEALAQEEELRSSPEHAADEEEVSAAERAERVAAAESWLSEVRQRVRTAAERRRAVSAQCLEDVGVPSQPAARGSDAPVAGQAHALRAAARRADAAGVEAFLRRNGAFGPLAVGSTEPAQAASGAEEGEPAHDERPRASRFELEAAVLPKGVGDEQRAVLDSIFWDPNPPGRRPVTAAAATHHRAPLYAGSEWAGSGVWQVPDGASAFRPMAPVSLPRPATADGTVGSSSQTDDAPRSAAARPAGAPSDEAPRAAASPAPSPSLPSAPASPDSATAPGMGSASATPLAPSVPAPLTATRAREALPEIPAFRGRAAARRAAAAKQRCEIQAQLALGTLDDEIDDADACALHGSTATPERRGAPTPPSSARTRPTMGRYGGSASAAASLREHYVGLAVLSAAIVYDLADAAVDAAAGRGIASSPAVWATLRGAAAPALRPTARLPASGRWGGASSDEEEEARGWEANTTLSDLSDRLSAARDEHTADAQARGGRARLAKKQPRASTPRRALTRLGAAVRLTRSSSSSSHGKVARAGAQSEAEAAPAPEPPGGVALQRSASEPQAGFVVRYAGLAGLAIEPPASGAGQGAAADSPLAAASLSTSAPSEALAPPELKTPRSALSKGWAFLRGSSAH